MWTILREFFTFNLGDLEDGAAVLLGASPFYCNFAECERTV